ncbi:helix-turn-helix transcriptional regulator [Amedibacterium intestinale]|uniref:helix-turn-helix transcriptional regulator n=1 Tax=Amedibacterium intestinale TaxID=2583452 RepID=UPI000E4E9C4B|nr:AraC family transcriptional regulator [Amedibacterium intestinale]RHO21194.1 AraC family transcriptional regulator [Eubacterium sp. AM18-26]RHO25386.1 AraC family transcriptional regulator [Eubacterium sp. AM18-10LB-B]RHO31621.1 AraC family transcriptional regulator [Erysipelotrichaceae bacterium AM17-60]
MKSTYEIIKPNPDQDVMIHLINAETMKASNFPIDTTCIPPHWHRSIEFSYIRKGSAKLTIQNKTRMLHEGDFIFVNSAQIHQIASDNLTSEVLLLIIPYDFLKKAIPSIDSLVFDIYDKPYHPMFFEIFDFFYQSLTSPKEYDKLKIDAYVYMLLHILVTSYQIENIDKSYISNQKLQRDMLDYIETNYKHDISLCDFAERFHLNAEYVSRLFKSLFGVNFKTYLTNYRLNSSMNDIVYSKKSMQDIAYAYGFSSVKSFIFSFKGYYNQTPYQYRLYHQKKTK